MVEPSRYEGMVEGFDEFLGGIDLVLVMVDHKQLSVNEDKLEGKIIFDTKNIIRKYPTYKL